MPQIQPNASTSRLLVRPDHTPALFMPQTPAIAASLLCSSRGSGCVLSWNTTRLLSLPNRLFKLPSTVEPLYKNISGPGGRSLIWRVFLQRGWLGL
jgi:hypothetical protein